MRNRTWLWLVAVAMIGLACDSGSPKDELGWGSMDPTKIGAMDPNRMGVLDKENTTTISERMPGPLDIGYAVSAGGLQDDVASAAVLDKSGDLIVAGTFYSSAQFDRLTLTASNGRKSVYVAKLDDQGRFRWAVALPATPARDGIAVDGAGNVYYAGSFAGTVKIGSTTLTAVGEQDVLIVKMSPSGEILAAMSAGGASSEHAERIVVDSAGITIAGAFSGVAQFGRDKLVSRGGSDAYVARIDASGKFVWAVSAGSDSRVAENAAGLAVDGAGQTYVTGHFAGNAEFGRLNLSSDAENGEAYIAKLDAAGGFVWVSSLSSRTAPLEEGRNLVLDGANHLYLTASLAIPGQSKTPVVARLDNNGELLWTREVHGRGRAPAWISGLVADTDTVTIAGAFSSTKSIGGKILASAGDADAFLARLDYTGMVQWAQEVGGAGSDAGIGLAADRHGHLYVAGAFTGTLALGRNALVSMSRDASDAFVWKMTPPRRN